MYNRRNSLRNSQQRYSGLSPAAAAAMVSFNQQNPRQNNAVLAAGAAAEALRRHSLDAQGAQMAANFRRNSITSQTGGRTESMTRRNSLRTTSTVNRDQHGRAMSLTKTTVRQMGSFQLVKEEETAVRRPAGGHAHPPESLYSLDSFAEEPEYTYQRGYYDRQGQSQGRQGQNQGRQSQRQGQSQNRQNQGRQGRQSQTYQDHDYRDYQDQSYQDQDYQDQDYQDQDYQDQDYQDHQDHPHRPHKSRVSFLDDTSEFHYDAYDNSESNAIAAAAAVAPQRHLKPAALVRQSSKSRSPMKSALKKHNLEQSPISFSSYDEPEPIYEQEQVQEQEQEEEEEEEHEQVEDGDFRNRPLSAVSEFSTITAKSRFEDSDDDASVETYRSNTDIADKENRDLLLQNTNSNQFVDQDEYSPSENEDEEAVRQPLTVAIPDSENNFAGPSSTNEPSQLPSLAIADVSPVKRGEQGDSIAQGSPSRSQAAHLGSEVSEQGQQGQQGQLSGQAQGHSQGHSQGQSQGQRGTHPGQARSGQAPPGQARSGQAPPGQFGPRGHPVNGHAPNVTLPSSNTSVRRQSSLRTGPGGPGGPANQSYRSQPIARQDQRYPVPQANQQQRQRQAQQAQQAQSQQRQRPQQPHQYAQGPKHHEAGRTSSMTRSNSIQPRSGRLSMPPNATHQSNNRTESPNRRESFAAPPSLSGRSLQLQPSPSIDGFNRIGNTDDILEKARNRARAFSPEQHDQQQPMRITSAAQMENDDAASINSESSWKRSTTATRSRFRSTSADTSSPVNHGAGAGAGAGPRTMSITSSQAGSGSRTSRSGGRTYSLRGAPPPDLNRNWRSRFEDSDDEDTSHAPTALPQVAGGSSTQHSSGGKKKKPGFFKKLFAKHI